MRTVHLCRILSLLLVGLLLSMPAPAADSDTPLAVNYAGFATPESIEYYADKDIYLVSNINGDPFAADDNGFISKISPDGTLIDLKWIDGARDDTTLNAPKGMTILGQRLYVADINQIQVFSLPDGKQVDSIMIHGSSFLNGMAPGRSGDYLYVTDSGYLPGFKPSSTDAVYKVYANGQYRALSRNPAIGHPNGVWEEGTRLIVVTFGSGKVYSLSANGAYQLMPTPPKGVLDGIVRLDDGRFLISSWQGSAVYILNNDNSYSVLMDSLDAPADMGFDTKRQRVLVPLFKQNRLIFIPL